MVTHEIVRARLDDLGLPGQFEWRLDEIPEADLTAERLFSEERRQAYWAEQPPYGRFARAILLEEPDDPDLRHIENMRFDLWIGDEQLEAARKVFGAIYGRGPFSAGEMRAHLSEFMSPEYAPQFADGLDDLPAASLTADGVITLERLEAYWQVREDETMQNRKGKTRPNPYRDLPDIREVRNEEDVQAYLKAATKAVEKEKAQERADAIIASPAVRRTALVLGLALVLSTVTYLFVAGFARDRVVSGVEDMMVPQPAEPSQQTLDANALFDEMVASGEIPADTNVVIFNSVRLSDGDPALSDMELAKLRGIVGKIEGAQANAVNQ